MNRILNFGKGYGTYFVGAIAVLLGVLELITSLTDKETAYNTILLGAGLLGLRRALK